MANALITGLSDEEIKQMHEWEIGKSREIGYAEGLYEAVNRFVKEGTFTVEKACEILGVSVEAYMKYREENEA